MVSKSRVRAPRGEAGFEVFCGIDVAREMHHAVALNAAGDRLVDRPLPNAEPDLVKLFEQLQVHGRVLVVVDQLASIGALAIAVARSRGIAVAYLPGLSMRRIADLYPGEGKTDARDAHIIADAARTLPHALRGVGPDERTTVELAVLAGYDADLADESTRLMNRLHDALSHVHPSLERLLGKHFHCPGVLRLLAATGTPAAIGQLGDAGIATLMADGSPRLARTLPARIITALADQSVTIPATAQYGRVIRGLAAQLLTVLAQRKTLRGELEELLAVHPLAEILTSMPGVGPRTAIELLRTVGDGSGFPVRSAHRLLRGLGADHPTVRPKHQGRTPAPPRQPSPEERPVPVRVLQPSAPGQPRLLRPETRRGQEPHRCPDLPSETAGRRPARHDPGPPAVPARTP